MSGPDPFGLTAAGLTGVQVAQVPAGGWTSAVVLDRVVDVAREDTAYCIHGQATCTWCGAWCWLGDRTHALVSAGTAAPSCRQCAARYAPRTAGPVGNAADHRRSDGPH